MRIILLVIFLLFIDSSIAAQVSDSQEQLGDNLEIQLNKGIQAFNKGKHAKAERIFDKLLKEEQSYAEAYLWKGKCLQEFEEYQAAYDAINTAKNLIPDHAPYWFEIGNFKYHLGVTSIRKPEVCGDCGHSLLPETGEMLKAPDYYKSALKDYEKAIELDTNYADAYYQMALTYYTLSNKPKACAVLEKAKNLKHTKAMNDSKAICP
jgi:tetratricopeptide (TPR) repeat protein